MIGKGLARGDLYVGNVVRSSLCCLSLARFFLFLSVFCPLPLSVSLFCRWLFLPRAMFLLAVFPSFVCGLFLLVFLFCCACFSGCFCLCFVLLDMLFCSCLSVSC